jgi:tripartite motif-containing protein 71
MKMKRLAVIVALGVACSLTVCRSATGAVPVFVLEWQAGYVGGMGMPGWSGPHGIAWSPDGVVYVTDTNLDQVNVFSPTGVPVGSWGTSGSGNGELLAPDWVAVGPNRNVYVVDGGEGDAPRVQEFTPGGTFVRGWSVGGHPDDVMWTWGMAIGPDGTIFITDEWHYQVLAFDRTGAFLRQWGTRGTGPGQFLAAHGIAVSPSGVVYVSDPLAHRISAFASDGGFLFSWGSAGSGDGQFGDVEGLCTDLAGRVYACDRGNNLVQVFSSEGEFIGKWSTYDLDVPYQAAVNGNTMVFVLFTAGGTVGRYDYLATPAARPSWGRVKSLYR